MRCTFIGRTARLCGWSTQNDDGGLKRYYDLPRKQPVPERTYFMVYENLTSGLMSPGERWKQLALVRLRQPLFDRPWIRLGQRLQTRYVRGLAQFDKLQQRIQDQRRRQAPALLRRLGRLALASPLKSSRTSRQTLDLTSSPERGELRALESNRTARETLDLTSSPKRGKFSRMASETLDPRIQRYLEQLLKFRLPTIQVHTSAAADRLARRYGADAVTSRAAIYFRQDAFDLSTSKGLGLIAHEATHVAWAHGARPIISRMVPLNPAAVEEQSALENERRVLRQTAHGHLMSGPAPVLLGSISTKQRLAATHPPAPPAADVPGVKTAPSSRELNSSDATAASPLIAMPSETQLRALKDDIYRTLLDKLRSEFERGA